VAGLHQELARPARQQADNLLLTQPCARGEHIPAEGRPARAGGVPAGSTRDPEHLETGAGRRTIAVRVGCGPE
jgi:hypothetical protein